MKFFVESVTPYFSHRDEQDTWGLYTFANEEFCIECPTSAKDQFYSLPSWGCKTNIGNMSSKIKKENSRKTTSYSGLIWTHDGEENGGSHWSFGLRYVMKGIQPPTPPSLILRLPPTAQHLRNLKHKGPPLTHNIYNSILKEKNSFRKTVVRFNDPNHQQWVIRKALSEWQ